MSVLIKGMEMPKSRGQYTLHMYVHSDGTATVEGSYCQFEGEPFVAIPVPPHEVVGTWEWDPDGIDYGIGAWKCSNCGSKAETWWAKDGNSNPLKFAGSHYCGNCGAAMRRK